MEEAKHSADQDQTLQFLLQMKASMFNLRTRLNNEIRHKMALIKQVATLKQQLKEAEEKVDKQAG